MKRRMIVGKHSGWEGFLLSRYNLQTRSCGLCIGPTSQAVESNEGSDNIESMSTSSWLVPVCVKTLVSCFTFSNCRNHQDVAIRHLSKSFSMTSTFFASSSLVSQLADMNLPLSH
jgi:hypothetical protein